MESARIRIAAAGVAALLLGFAAGGIAHAVRYPGPPDSAIAQPSGSPRSSEATPPSTGSPTGPAATPAPTEAPTEAPTATPEPTPVLVAAPLTGLMVAPELAARHAVAVMIDDQALARPQSGFNAASIVWQAPAEGGIPRYMMVFAENQPGAVGPIRSARQYFIAWAAEWRAVYTHVGGSPQALATLRAKGKGQYVYNADEFRFGTRYFWRIKQRRAPHNMYSDGAHLRALAKAIKAKDQVAAPAWTFAEDAPLETRPTGGRIEVRYPANRIRYDYDRASNSYLRFTNGKKQVDAADGRQVAPRNVAILVMRFAPLRDGSKKHRLEAQFTGKGVAYIATNGRTIKGQWRKASFTAPTLLFDSKGRPVPLTVGQTFVQVVPVGTQITLKAGTPPPVATPSPSPVPSPSQASPSPEPSSGLAPGSRML